MGFGIPSARKREPGFFDYALGMLFDSETPSEVRQNYAAREMAIEKTRAQMDMLRELGGMFVEDEPAPTVRPTSSAPTEAMTGRWGDAQKVLAEAPAAPEPTTDVAAVRRRAGLTPRLPSWDDAAPILARASLAGLPVDKVLDIVEKSRPDLEATNGHVWDKRDAGNVGRFLGEAPVKGARPLYDETGRPVAWDLMNGTLQAIERTTAAEEGARAAAKAPYEFESYEDAEGRPVRAAKSTMVDQVRVGQSPADEAEAVKVAEGRADAINNLGKVTGAAATALDLISKMRVHEGLDSRVGWRGALPAIPNTAGADLDAMQAQLEGKVFLEAFNDLRGGGQITEREGQKASDAMARLSKRQTKEGYLEALTDLENVIIAGARRAQAKAGGGNSPAARAAVGLRTAGQGFKIVGVR